MPGWESGRPRVALSIYFTNLFAFCCFLRGLEGLRGLRRSFTHARGIYFGGWK